MSSLDIQYVTELVRHAKEKDSNAFAELFAATHQKQYQFCCHYLEDPLLAQEALQETYVQLLSQINRLTDNALIIAFLTQINFRVCLKIKQKQDPFLPTNPTSILVSIGNRQYTLHQLMSLPFTESQVLVLKWFCQMKAGRIASLMELTRREVRDYLISGMKRLPQYSMEGGQS